MEKLKESESSKVSENGDDINKLDTFLNLSVLRQQDKASISQRKILLHGHKSAARSSSVVSSSRNRNTSQKNQFVTMVGKEGTK